MEALSRELTQRGVAHEREVAVPIFYKGAPLGAPYRADMVVEGVLLELKAIQGLGRIEEAQVVHYLKATGTDVGLLLNFGSTSLQVRRLTNRPRRSAGLEPGSP